MVKLNGRFIIGKSITRSSRNELYKSNAFMAAQASQGSPSFLGHPFRIYGKTIEKWRKVSSNWILHS